MASSSCFLSNSPLFPSSQRLPFHPSTNLSNSFLSPSLFATTNRKTARPSTSPLLHSDPPSTCTARQTNPHETNPPHRNKSSFSTPKPTQTAPRFDWYNQWYPVSLISDLNITAPNAFKILDIDIVAWRSPNRKNIWSVFHDRCPHRYAALSEGRINTVTQSLECGYHGWQFATEGNCINIPQSEKPASVLAPICAQSLPCMQQNGILFAWMGNKTPPEQSQPAVIHDRRAKHVVSSFTRILPLCFTTLLQNVLDPAHIHFAHHNQIGHRHLGAPVPIRVLISQAIDGFTADYYSGTVRLRFRPPCLIEIVTSKGSSFAYYAIPISSGLVRTIAIRGTAYRPLFRQPRWLDHCIRNQLVEGDLQLMITQQREMKKVPDTDTYTGAWSHFHMPTSADKLIVELRRWLKNNEPSHSCTWFAFPDYPNFEESYLRRLDGHTKECKDCMQLRSFLTRGRAILKLIGTILFLIGTVLLQSYKPVWLVLLLVILAHAAASRLIQKLE